MTDPGPELGPDLGPDLGPAVGPGPELRIVVIGLPALGSLLAAGVPGGVAVVSIAAGPAVDIDREVAARARGARRDDVAFVIAAGVDPAVDRLPARLARGEFRAVVLTGLAAPTLPFPSHPALVSLAAPFTADDVLAAVSRLPGELPLLLPVEGGDRVFAAGSAPAADPPAPPPPGPTLDEWLAGPAGDDAGADAPAEPDRPTEPAEPADDDPLGPLVEAPQPGDPSDDDPLGPLVEPEPALAAALTATVGAVAVDASPDLPRWAHLPPPPPPPPPVDRPVPWADGGWPVPPVIPGDALPTPGGAAGDGRRRGRVLSVCSYKGGSGKCLTGDSLVVDPVTGVPHRLDAVVADPALGAVFTLCGTTIRCAPITDKVDSGVQPTVRVELASGRRVTVTPHHPFLLPDGWRPAHAIAVGEAVAVAARTPFPRRPVRVCGSALVALAREVAAGPAAMPAAVYRLPADQLAWVLALLWQPGEGGPGDGGMLANEALARAVQHLLTRFAVATRIWPCGGGRWRVTVTGVAPGDRAWDEVVAIVPAGERRVWDLCVEPTRCFVADDVVVHNTTTALLAAGTLARALRPVGKRVALVDANTAQSSIGTVLQRPARGSVLDLVRSDVDEGVLAAALTPVPEAGGLDVLLGAPDLRTADRGLVTTGLYRRIVATLRRTHDYVIVDTPVAEAVDHELFEDFVLRDSDLLVVVLDPHRETIHNNVEWLDIIGDPVSAGGRNVVPERIGVVLNRADPAQGWNGRTVGDQFRRYRYLGAIPESPAIARAADEARLLDRFDPAVDRAVRTILAALVAEPLVGPDPEPPASTPLARFRRAATRLRPGRNALHHG